MRVANEALVLENNVHGKIVCRNTTISGVWGLGTLSQPVCHVRALTPVHNARAREGHISDDGAVVCGFNCIKMKLEVPAATEELFAHCQAAPTWPGLGLAERSAQ